MQFVNNQNNESNKYSNINIDNSKLNIFYFNVGQADCTLITINNKNILIDAGNKSDGDYIVEFIKEKNLENIDYSIYLIILFLLTLILLIYPINFSAPFQPPNIFKHIFEVM